MRAYVTQNVLLTGDAGSGKSYIVEELIRVQSTRLGCVSVTALTGEVASLYPGGTTLHHWAGLRPHDVCANKSALKDIVQRACSTGDVLARVRSTSVLVIDEASMMTGALIELVHRVCCFARGTSSNRPMGGITMVMVGDWKQLPPIPSARLVADGTSMDVEEAGVVNFDIAGLTQDSLASSMPLFAFETDVWKSLNLQTVRLTTQHRQQDASASFARLLAHVGSNDVDEIDMQTASALARELPADLKVVHLVATRSEAADINLQCVICPKLFY